MPLAKYKFLPGDGLPAANANSIDPDLILAQAAGYLSGGVNMSPVTVFQTLGSGANNGKFKINIDGNVYDNVGASCNIALTEEVLINQIVATGGQSAGNTAWIGQWFTVAEDGLLTNFTVNTYSGPSYYDTLGVKFYKADANGLPSGSPIQSWTQQFVVGDYSDNTFTLTTPYAVVAGEKYVIVLYDVSTHGISVKASATNVYAGGNLITSANSGSTWSQNTAVDLYFIVRMKKNSTFFNTLATNIQTAIRALTSKLETVIYSSNKFIITSATVGRSSSVLKLMTPSTGTDISGNNATKYLDCGSGATETAGVGDEYYLMRLGSNNKIPKGVSNAGANQVTTGRALGTVYQNTSLNPIMVSASVNYYDTNNNQPYAQALIGPTNSPATVVSYFKLALFASSSTSTLMFIVPPGYYYKVDSNAGGSYGGKSISYWYECDLI